MLPQDPPTWIMRWTAWVLLAFVGFALIIAIFMKLPETVRCPFVLVPATGADPIQSPHAAIISRVGTIVGCYVTSGKITRNAKVRVVRDAAAAEDRLFPDEPASELRAFYFQPGSNVAQMLAQGLGLAQDGLTVSGAPGIRSAGLVVYLAAVISFR